MTTRRKQEAVLRVLRGEPLETVARACRATAAELSGWRDTFLEAGATGLFTGRALQGLKAAQAAMTSQPANFPMCYGREFCGRPGQHPYELFLQLEAVEHRTTRVKRPQSNGIVEHLHRTLLDEHFRVEGAPYLVRDHRRKGRPFSTPTSKTTTANGRITATATRAEGHGRRSSDLSPKKVKWTLQARPAQPPADEERKENRSQYRLNNPLNAALSGQYQLCTV
jgi:hypothetical protein